MRLIVIPDLYGYFNVIVIAIISDEYSKIKHLIKLGENTNTMFNFQSTHQAPNDNNYLL